MRLLVHVEGQTEETFVNELLADYLYDRGFTSVSARLLGNSRLRLHRGGIRSWFAVRKEIAGHLKEDGGAIATTMVDYYALPQGVEGWPGRYEASARIFDERAATVEAAIHADLMHELGVGANSSRFVPYIAMHEFEGLLFSDCEAFAAGLGAPALAPKLLEIRSNFETPEHINDSPETAPSKRVLRVAPTYQKTLHGPLAAIEMGIDVMRQQCSGFDRWITRLVQAV